MSKKKNSFQDISVLSDETKDRAMKTETWPLSLEMWLSPETKERMGGVLGREDSGHRREEGKRLFLQVFLCEQMNISVTNAFVMIMTWSVNDPRSGTYQVLSKYLQTERTLYYAFPKGNSTCFPTSQTAMWGTWLTCLCSRMYTQLVVRTKKCLDTSVDKYFHSRQWEI